MGFVAILVFVVLPALFVGGGALVAWYSLARRRRLGRAVTLAEAPARDVAITGRARGPSLVSPITHRACVWYDVDIEVRTGVAKYESVMKLRSDAPFEIGADDGGCVRIDVARLWLASDGARHKEKTKGGPQHILQNGSQRWHRVTESIIAVDAIVTALGDVEAPAEGYRASGAELPILGAKGEAVVSAGDRASMGATLAKHVLLGLGLLTVGLAWVSVSVWFFVR
ncbi:MAG: hypothetical protein KF819_19245 [Labilithrix sp.]|nr:hypothetical protein [Labilithrix sp.]